MLKVVVVKSKNMAKSGSKSPVKEIPVMNTRGVAYSRRYV